MKWFRLYDELIDDSKVHDMTDSEFRVFIYLMCLANRQKVRGVIPLKPTQISRTLRLHTNRVKPAIETFQKMGIIAVENSNPQISFINWDKRQFISDDIYGRVKRYRNKKETLPDTDTDTDTDTEKEKSIKKKRFGAFKNVRLTSKEYEKLINRFGKHDAKQRIENLGEYIASKGKKYKSHYATILNWSRRDRKSAGLAKKQRERKAIMEFDHD